MWQSLDILLKLLAATPIPCLIAIPRLTFGPLSTEMTRGADLAPGARLLPLGRRQFLPGLYSLLPPEKRTARSIAETEALIRSGSLPIMLLSVQPVMHTYIWLQDVPIVLIRLKY